MIWTKDEKYDFVYGFDPSTGMYIRTDVLDENGRETGIQPFRASMPHLIDVGIMGRCIHGSSGLCAKSGVQCYQNGPRRNDPNMTLENFELICKQCSGKVQQFALGGAGDPDQHENFEEILKLCRTYGIVPNFTTSGLGMTPEIAVLCKQYCGAVAVSQYSRLKHVIIGKVKNKYWDAKDEQFVSQYGDKGEWYMESEEELGTILDNLWCEYHHKWDDDKIIFKDVYYESGSYTIKAIHMLLDAGVKTNIHYVVGNQSIDELLIRLRINGFPKSINAVVLLLHKPVGLGMAKNVLEVNDDRVGEMYQMLSEPRPFKIGMDSCNVPGAINFCNDMMLESLDTCEGGRFSCYIGADMIMVPCSFDQDKKYGCDLRKMTIQDAWDSDLFEAFRNIMRGACPNCKNRENCLGGCPLKPEIVLCNKKEKKK